MRDVSGGAEKSEDYSDVAELKNEPKADNEPGQQSEGEEEKSSYADMIYAVVDKCLLRAKTTFLALDLVLNIVT